MRKVFVSTLVLSMSMGIMYDVSAQRNRASVITSRTARAGNRGNSSSSSSSQSSSSTTNVDITTTTQRFKNNKYDFDSKLYYDKEYELQDFLTSATYNYYYNNGSNSINEQLCFGPYMFVNKNTNNTNYMDYIGVEKSEAKRTCIDIMPNMTYTIGLIPASDSAVETASAEGRYLTIQNNNFPSRDIKKLLSTEKYVDVSEYAKSITDTFNNVKTYCGNYNENMDSIRKQLGAVLGTSVFGTAFSAGATAVNVLNVKKTEETGRYISENAKNQERIEELKEKYLNEDDSVDTSKTNLLTGENEPLSIDNAIKKLEDKLEVNETCLANQDKVKFDTGKLNNIIDSYNAKRTKMIEEVAKESGWKTINGECTSEKEHFKKYNLYEEFCKDRLTDVKAWQEIMKNNSDNNEKWCGEKWSDEKAGWDNGQKYGCMKKYITYLADQQYGKPLNEGDFDGLTLEQAKSKFNPKVLTADIEEFDKNFDDQLDNAQTTKEKCENNEDIETIIKDLNEYKRLTENNEMAEKIDANNKSSKVMDWTNVGLSGASTIASGISIGFSSTALAKVKEALENLEKCQKSLTELKTIFAEYNAEIEAEEGE